MNYQVIIDRGIALGVLLELGLPMNTSLQWLHLPNEMLLGWSPMELIEMGRVEEVVVHISNIVGQLRKDLGTEDA